VDLQLKCFWQASSYAYGNISPLSHSTCVAFQSMFAIQYLLQRFPSVTSVTFLSDDARTSIKQHVPFLSWSVTSGCWMVSLFLLEFAGFRVLHIQGTCLLTDTSTESDQGAKNAEIQRSTDCRMWQSRRRQQKRQGNVKRWLLKHSNAEFLKLLLWEEHVLKESLM
jgi:hypothetical protein